MWEEVWKCWREEREKKDRWREGGEERRGGREEEKEG